MLTEEIANHILNTEYKNISKEDINSTKKAFIDYLAVTNKGINEKPTQIALKTLKNININTKPTKYKIIGCNDNNYLNEIETGFINGISAHVLDLDDGHRLGQIHPGAVIFSTALALSQKYNLNSKNFIEAVIIGYDTAISLGQLFNPQHRNKGFHTSGTLGTLSAGATASKLLKLNKKQIISAIGLCGTQAAGLLESDHSGSMGKTLHIGKAIQNGIISAYLAKNNFTGAKSIIEGNEGLINTMATEITEEKIEKFKKDLNKHNINEIYYKKYPFCRHLHSSIDSGIKINKYLLKNNMKNNTIKNITIKTYKIAAEHNNYKPKNNQELKQSLPLAVAITIKLGNPNLNLIEKLLKNNILDYSQEKYAEIYNLIKIIKIQEDKNLNDSFPKERPSNIEITLNNGENINFLTKIPLGEKENPLTKDDIIKKFKELNPKYDINKLKIIENMEDYKINTIINKLN